VPRIRITTNATLLTKQKTEEILNGAIFEELWNGPMIKEMLQIHLQENTTRSPSAVIVNSGGIDRESIENSTLSMYMK